MPSFCRTLSTELQLGVITNDIYTDEDARFLRSEGVLEADRIRAVETGACPHTAIRDDVASNLIAFETLEGDYAAVGTPLDVVLVESGGDNLTATFSPALVDAQLFVLDVAGGGDVARKGGPGIARADLLVVNKTDLGPYVGVGVDVERMVADAQAARDGRPVLALSRPDAALSCGWPIGYASPSPPMLRATTLRSTPGPWRHIRTRTAPATPTSMATSTRIEVTPDRCTLGGAQIVARRVRSGTQSEAVRVALVASQALLLAGDHIRISVTVSGDATSSWWRRRERWPMTCAAALPNGRSRYSSRTARD